MGFILGFRAFRVWGLGFRAFRAFRAFRGLGFRLLGVWGLQGFRPRLNWHVAEGEEGEFLANL